MGGLETDMGWRMEAWRRPMTTRQMEVEMMLTYELHREELGWYEDEADGRYEGLERAGLE